MFIIKCFRDKSYCKVDDNNVVFDQNNPPNEGTEVYFFYNKLKELGQVIIKSDQMDVIDDMFDHLKKEVKSRKHETSSDDDENKTLSPIIPKKRPRKVNHKYSSQSYENLDLSILTEKKNDFIKGSMKKRKKGDNKLPSSIKQELSRSKSKTSVQKDLKKKGEDLTQSVIEQELADVQKETSTRKVSSPSKEELKKMLEEAEKQLTLAKNSKASSKRSQASVVKESLTNKGKENNADDSRTASEESDCSIKENVNFDTDEEDYFAKYKRPKKAEKNFDSDNVKEVYPVNYNDNKDTKKIFDTKNEPETHEVIESNNAKEQKSNDERDLIEDSDLYGKDWNGEQMVKLIHQVYCKKSEYDLAKSLSTQATHLARRLITGVFKPSGYLNATFTGQSPRARKTEQQPLRVKPLNEVARNEIIDYAIQRASIKQWKNRKGLPQTREEIERAMSQRVGELKRSNELTQKKKISKIKISFKTTLQVIKKKKN